jgi:hypothetical protein
VSIRKAAERVVSTVRMLRQLRTNVFPESPLSVQQSGQDLANSNIAW